MTKKDDDQAQAADAKAADAQVAAAEAQTDAAKAEVDAAQAKEDEAKALAERQANAPPVGDRPNVPVDADHAPVHPDTDPNASAPLNAEHLPNPADAYAQNPPPLREAGPARATEPPSVHVPPAVGGEPFDARGNPVNPEVLPNMDQDAKRS